MLFAVVSEEKVNLVLWQHSNKLLASMKAKFVYGYSTSILSNTLAL